MIWLEALQQLVSEFNDHEPTLEFNSLGSCIEALLNEHEEMIEKIKRKDGLQEAEKVLLIEQPEEPMSDDKHDKEDDSQPEKEGGSQADDTPQPDKEATPDQSKADEEPKTLDKGKSPATEAEDVADDDDNDDNDDAPGVDQGGTHVITGA